MARVGYIAPDRPRGRHPEKRRELLHSDPRRDRLNAPTCDRLSRPGLPRCPRDGRDPSQTETRPADRVKQADRLSDLFTRFAVRRPTSRGSCAGGAPEPRLANPCSRNSTAAARSPLVSGGRHPPGRCATADATPVFVAAWGHWIIRCSLGYKERYIQSGAVLNWPVASVHLSRCASDEGRNICSSSKARSR